ncbi:MAG: hypothetical protein HY746_07890 [Elusimicrobia bacterium]|nr:hypothetical protein [Elusimicrobiota bacterium]
MNRRLTAILLIFAVFPPSTANSSADGGSPGSFLRHPVGARAGAAGFWQAAVVDDATAVYWNPAGLSLVKKPEVNFAGTRLFEDTDYSFFGVARHIGKNKGFGAGYIRQSSGGFEKRTNPFESGTGFSIYNEAFFAGFGMVLNEKKIPAGAGFALKRVSHKIDVFSDADFGLDFGIMAGPFKKFRFSGLITNAVKPEIKLVSRPVKYPAGWNFSFAWENALYRNWSLLAGAGLEKIESQEFQTSAGAEISYNEKAFLRFGVADAGFSGGAGVKMGNYSLDYSVVLHEISPLHTIGVSVRFGITMEELEGYIKQGMTRFSREEAGKLADVYSQQAEIFFKDKNYGQAVKTMETAVLWDPENAGMAEKLKQYKQEMENVLNRQIIERNSILALQYYERGDFEASRRYWQNVLEITPENSQAMEYIAKIDEKLSGIEKERIEQAKKEEALKAVHSLFNEAVGFLNKENYPAAILRARKALALSTDNQQVKSILLIAQESLNLSIEKRIKQAAILCENRQYAEALKIIETVFRDSPDNKEAAQKAEICKASGPPEISLENRKKVEKLYYMAVDAYLKNDYKGAEKHIAEIYIINLFDENTRKLEEKIKKMK